MKGIFRLGLFALIGALIFTSSWAVAASPNYLLYRSPKGFSIRYPENWTVKNESNDSVDFQSPWENNNDEFREYVNITIIDLESRMSMKQVTNFMLEYLPKYITDFNLLWQEDAYLSDENACMMAYTGRQGQFRFRWKNVFTIKNNRIYSVALKAESEKYDQYIDTAERMFNSFRIGAND